MWRELQKIELDDTLISGTLTSHFNDFQSLLQFDANSNRLSGTFPPTLSHAATLTRIALGDDDIRGVSGTLPSWLAVAPIVRLEIEGMRSVSGAPRCAVGRARTPAGHATRDARTTPRRDAGDAPSSQVRCRTI